MVDVQGFPHNVGHCHPRVEGGIGVLENHLHLFAVGHKPTGVQVGDILAIISDFSAGRVIKPNDGPPGRRLSAAGLAHQPEGFPPVYCKGNIIYRFDIVGFASDNAAYFFKVHFQVFHFHQMFSHAAHLPFAFDNGQDEGRQDNAANILHSGLRLLQTQEPDAPCKYALQIHIWGRKGSPPED